MTIASDIDRSGPYDGNGVTTIFNYGFRIVDDAHLDVIKKSVSGVDATLALGSDYIVSGVGDAGGGQVALTVAPAVGEKITILRNVPFVQETDLENQGAYFAQVVEDAFDLAVMRDQQLAEKMGRAVTVPPDVDQGMTITPGANGQVPTFDENGNMIPTTPSPGLGNMQREIYDPSEIGGDAFNTAKHKLLTTLAVAATVIPAVVLAFQTYGYNSAGDGGGALYERLSEAPIPVKPWHRQSSDGAWWQIAKGQDIHVEMFGAKSFTEAQVLAINGGPQIKGDDQLNATSAAFQAADDYMFEVKGGGVFYGRGQFYFYRGWEYNKGVYFDGAGHGKWMPSFPTEAKTWEGTNLVATGVAGKATYTVHGINSAEVSGGWRESLDTPGRFFKLTSLMNRDAAGAASATPRALKVFIRNKNRHGDKGGVLNCRIVPFIGADGISTYSTQAGNDLGEAWDIGLLVDTMEGVYVSGVQARGYWRVAGMAELSPDWTSWSRSEANVFINSSATGMVGLLLRSSQQWRVLSVNTANPADMQVTIPWDIENPWNPAGGQVNLNSAGGYCTYTSIERSGDNLIFHGLSEDPTGATFVRAPYRGTGFSTGTFMNFEAWALWHHSGQNAEALGLGRPSTGFECSGFPMRGVNFYNFSAFGEDSVSPAMHLHNCFDFNFFGGKAEIGIVLASTTEANQALPATAAGTTNNIGLHGFQFTSSIDFRHGYWKPRSQRNLQEQFTPLGELSTDMLILKAMENQEFRLKMAAGKNFRVVNSDNSFPFTIFSSGNGTFAAALTLGTTGVGLIGSVTGQAFHIREGSTNRLIINATTGSVVPGADNTQNLGTGTARWAQLFAGTATINTSDERVKREIEAITEAVLDAWDGVEWCQYRFIDGNRLHMGLVAQRVQAALEAHGLDPFDLGLLCHDEWEDIFEDVYEERDVIVHVLDEQGFETGEFHTEKEIVPTGEKRLATPAGNRYGLRYEECFAVEAAYQRRRIDRLEARLSAVQGA
ncbi:hypothetical protein GOA90_25165 [Sinorhizobium meliloti]|nr:hypothetical protein [Sinorhizobium meliloti]